MIPILSIVIPTFNSSETLRCTLDSIVSQTFMDYEVLIIDNCSTDNTVKIAEVYTTLNKAFFLISEPDRGIYDAMNKGIRMAKGKWIYFLGSDDKFYDGNVLSGIFSRKDINKEKVIYGDVLVEEDSGWAVHGQIYDGEFTLSKLIEKNICHQALFFNRRVLKRYGGFNIKYDICSDWDMNFRLWAAYKFFYLETIVAVFKGGNSSYRIPNNFTDTEKWISIVKHFKYKTATAGFSDYSQNFLELSRHYKERNKNLSSFLLKILYKIHNHRN